LEAHIKSDSVIENHQFGFKAGHSIGLCTSTSIGIRIVDCYTNRDRVFVCSINIQKVFDIVNYGKLFLKLLDDDANNKIVKILSVWCSKQMCCVRWHVVSAGFTMGSGTRQGGTLSPYLFSRYITELLWAISGTVVGCLVGNHSFNTFTYADDLDILAPS